MATVLKPVLYSGDSSIIALKILDISGKKIVALPNVEFFSGSAGVPNT